MATRVKGFAPWNPRQSTKDVLNNVQKILDQYEALLPLTCRQIFYRLVATYMFAKTEKAYKNLCEYLNRARRSGVIGWNSIRDDGATAVNMNYWVDADEYISTLCSQAPRLELDLLQHQDLHVEVICEAAGMVPQLQRTCAPFTIPVRSGGGFDSVTTKHDLARFYSEVGKPVHVLHIGDLDPSGVHLAKNLGEDISAFMSTMGGEFHLHRIAVTEAQAVEFDLARGEVKSKDDRAYSLDYTVQAEALDPAVLARIVTDNIHSRIDLDVHNGAKAWLAEQRQVVTSALEGIAA